MHGFARKVLLHGRNPAATPEARKALVTKHLTHVRPRVRRAAAQARLARPPRYRDWVIYVVTCNRRGLGCMLRLVRLPAAVARERVE